MSTSSLVLGLESPVTIAREVDQHDVTRMTRYAENLAFYDGGQWTEKRRAGESRYIVNYARTLLRKSASYLFPTPPVWNVVDEQGKRAPASEQAELVLSESAAANGLHQLDLQTALEAAVLGDGVFKVTWDSERRTDIVQSVNPAQVWAWTAPDAVRRPQRVVQKYQLRLADARELFRSDAAVPSIERVQAAGNPSAFVTVCEDWTDERWIVEVNGAVWIDTANPYGWIPYVIFQNEMRPHAYWGESDLVDVIPLQRELNRRLNTVSRILEVSGYPITVLENVTGSEGVRVEPGAKWELPEDSEAYLLDMLESGGVRLHLEFIDVLKTMLHDVSETPRTAFGGTENALSGVALEVELQPLLQKVRRKRLSWTQAYKERSGMILALHERFGEADVGGLRRVSTTWGEVLPTDREQLVDETDRRIENRTLSITEAIERFGHTDPEATKKQIIEDERFFAQLDEGDDEDGDTGSAAGAS